MDKIPRTETFITPMGERTTMIHDIVKLARPTRGMWGYVRYIDRAKKELDLSDLIEIEGMPTFPAGMEMIVMHCDMTLPVIPCRFRYDDVSYTEVWFYAEDLIYVAGHQGQHLDGQQKTQDHG